MPLPDCENLHKVFKQVQLLICFVCNECVFRRGTMKQKELEILMEDMFAESKKINQINHADLFVVGHGRFEKCFNVGDDNSLIIHPELTQEPHQVFIVKKDEEEGYNEKNVITVQMLRRKTLKSSEPLSRSNIRSNAVKALKFCKLAMTAGKKYLDSNGNLPSGFNRQDYFDKVLDEMYKQHLNTKAEEIADGKEREKLRSQTRKPGWVFDGFMAFVMFGPLARDDRYISNNILLGASGTFLTNDCD